METQTKEFLIKLIEEQKQYVLEVEKGYNKIASGLFQNDYFRNFIFEHFGAGYFGETKTEWCYLDKGFIIDDMDEMIEK